MRNSESITIWCDESCVELSDKKFHLIGTLITNSDSEEYNFMNQLLTERKNVHSWNILHGSKFNSKSINQTKLIKKWFEVFKNNNKVFFHTSIFKENKKHSKPDFEKYFAKQSAFSLSYKMQNDGYPINTIFSKVRTVFFNFDRRRDESGDTLGRIYEDEIKKQLCKISKNPDLTVRFSFVNSSCFNTLQLADILLYMVKLRMQKENGIILSKEKESILKIWEDYFLNDKIKELKDFAYDQKFNVFKLKK